MHTLADRATTPTTPALEVIPGRMTRSAADRLAALTARGANAASAMIHLADGEDMRLVGGYALPAGFRPMQQVPMSTTLAGLVVHFRFPVVIADVFADPRVPPDAPARVVGVQAYAGFPVRDPAGEVVGVCAVMDYRPREWTGTELAAADDGAQACTAFVAERQARESQQEWRHFLDALLDSLDTGVVACDPGGRLVLVNRPLADRLGVDLQDKDIETWLAGTRTRQADGTPVTVARTPLAQALHGERLHGVEQTLSTADGGSRLFRVNANPITDELGRRLGAVSVFHDISEARRVAELQSALDQTKDDFLNLVGHELRTPLTVIASYLDLIADGDPATPLADSLPMVAAARRGSDRLRRLVEALLDLSTLDSGQAELHPSDMDLIQVVGRAVDAVRERAEANDLTIIERLPDRLPMRGDPDRLAQLASVLLDNAIAYTLAGGTVTVTVADSGGTARLEVADTGLGIPEFERPRVFDRFFRGAVATEMSIPGAGLGLAIAQLIVQRHHGSIALVPDIGRLGTTVRVSLPR